MVSIMSRGILSINKPFTNVEERELRRLKRNSEEQYLILVEFIRMYKPQELA